jgi:hypothetical protein
VAQAATAIDDGNAGALLAAMRQDMAQASA